MLHPWEKKEYRQSFGKRTPRRGLEDLGIDGG
jgi:hypothetical protein